MVNYLHGMTNLVAGDHDISDELTTNIKPLGD